MKLKVSLYTGDGYQWIFRDEDGDVILSYVEPVWLEERGCYIYKSHDDVSDIGSYRWRCNLPYGRDSLYRILHNGKLKKCKS